MSEQAAAAVRVRQRLEGLQALCQGLHTLDCCKHTIYNQTSSLCGAHSRQSTSFSARPFGVQTLDTPAGRQNPCKEATKLAHAWATRKKK